MLNRRTILLGLVAIISGMLIFVALNEALLFVVLDLLKISIPADPGSFVAWLALQLAPLAGGMLAVFLITYWWCRKKR
jgi:hypothetical protein